MRKLATIQIISDVQPIEGADRIQVASVLGWKVVIKKDEFKPGDPAIYCEVDSFLPVKPEFEFLRKSSYKKMSDGTEGFRLKTIKLRGVISQGLLIPVSSLPGYPEVPPPGTDVTDILGILKYEPPIPAQLAGEVKGPFPGFISKTDEERIQNLIDSLPNYKDSLFYVTEKVDGTSITIYLKDGQFGICSRNLELVENPENTYWCVVKELDIENKLRNLGRNIALQGELIGEGIQKNIYRLRGQTIKFFDAFDIDKYEYFDYPSFKSIIDEFGLATVPVIEEALQLPQSVDEILTMANGKSALNPDANREGLVFRTTSGKRFSFKAISNNFLLSDEE
ncbi:MAG: RNA ligase (ATP) [Ignavibacteria bacterium]|nr:RNA ligase (ATP) [Ignavibacteria bacterium]